MGRLADASEFSDMIEHVERYLEQTPLGLRDARRRNTLAGLVPVMNWIGRDVIDNNIASLFGQAQLNLHMRDLEAGLVPYPAPEPIQHNAQLSEHHPTHAT